MIITLDLSTSKVGITYYDSKTNELKLDYVRFSDAFKSLNSRAEYLIEYIKQKVNIDKETIFVIEDFLKVFKKGKSSINTIINLACFHSIFKYILHQLNVEYVVYNVLTARKLAGFKKNKLISIDTKQQVLDYIKKNLVDLFNNIVDKNLIYDQKRTGRSKEYSFDIADAIIILLAYLKEHHGK